MAKNRISKVALADLSPEQVEEIMGKLAIATSRKNELEAKLEQDIAALRGTVGDELLDLNATITAHSTQLQLYAEAHPELFTKKRSLESVHGTLGFRVSNPSVKLLKNMKWEDVLAAIKSLGRSWIRTKEEADKEAIIRYREEADAVDVYNAIGVKVVQEERFYIEFKSEEVLS